MKAGLKWQSIAEGGCLFCIYSFFFFLVFFSELGTEPRALCFLGKRVFILFIIHQYKELKDFTYFEYTHDKF